MFRNEKLAAEESITRRKFWLRALFLAAGLVTFGAVMIALDKDRKKGTNLRLYDYNHGTIDDEHEERNIRLHINNAQPSRRAAS
ncbi:hypothetical protein SPRG_11120 [Saprolegnia parasitica CBS 223.65]|uniref:Uncharacterized protein n=1 Tax=Saprolegnia parasitica (strain CBS 223.65) TaxID=695850 RepID=A0A067CA74_SAPPC|nr:hypothetical protein SPRG_11120 [Saprolegnia parasitica CBS 223.65]KDO23672.1 hypothetical protein SPRG_11120 [Saprolegnia parasitica CBS 223.65]|eukprot:XP_012205655.1 hypothetical protein SPRG_11120 [Saprolegnia parasitica CBS 223.65]